MIEDFEIESLVEQNDRYVSYIAYFNKSGRKCIIRRYLIDESTGLGEIHNWENEFNDLLNKFKRIDHPSLRTIIGGGIDPRDNSPYVVYERLHANSLSRLLSQSKSYNSSHAVEMSKSILEALSFLNSQSIIHGRISPENVLFTDVRDKSQWVLDWCPISSIRCKHDIERHRMDIYLAPELLTGSPPSHLTDLYSLGKTTQKFCGDQKLPIGLSQWIAHQTDVQAENRFQDAYVSFQALRNAPKEEAVPVTEEPVEEETAAEVQLPQELTVVKPKIINNIITTNALNPSKQLIPEIVQPKEPVKKLNPVELLKRTLKVRLKA